MAHITYTQLAKDKLDCRQDNKAIDCFRQALQFAKRTSNDTAVRGCKFNLGSALIAVHRASEGLKQLETIPIDGNNSQFCGDLLYNMALAHEQLSNQQQALLCYQQALNYYSNEPDSQLLHAVTACRLANIFQQQHKFDKAAEAYGIAAVEYQAAGNCEQQTVCLYQKAAMLSCLPNKETQVIQVADECLALCRTTDRTKTGDIYCRTVNDLGILYGQYGQHENCLSCFEVALSALNKCHVKSETDSARLKAILLQNIGAIYNCVGDFKTAIQSNNEAIALYDQVNSHSGKAECFNNLAFALSQLGDIDSAKHNYTRALQAARQSRDASSECHALEGLCSVSFHQHCYDECCQLLQKALATDPMTMSRNVVHKRLAGKLAHVIQIHHEAQSKKPQQHSAPHNARDSKSMDQRLQQQAALDSDSELDKQRTAYREQLERPAVDSNQQETDSETDVSSDGEVQEEEDSPDSDSTDTPQNSQFLSDSTPLNTAPAIPQQPTTQLNSTYLHPSSSNILVIDRQQPSESKFSIPSEDDPNYMTIRTTNRPPPLPEPRKSSIHNRSDQPPTTSRQQDVDVNAISEQQGEDDQDDEVDDSRSDDDSEAVPHGNEAKSDNDIKLPKKSSQVKTSRTCSVM